MDFFEQFMFDELEEQYAKDDLTTYDFEDIYERFTHLEHLDEVKPYLYAMCFLGNGTKAEPDKVLQELTYMELPSASPIRGLFLDIKLIMKKGNATDNDALDKCVEAGYSDKYLKKKSSLYTDDAYEDDDDENDDAVIMDDYIEKDEKIIVKNISFEGCWYSGLYFTSGDIDYLYAKVFIEPVKKCAIFLLDLKYMLEMNHSLRCLVMNLH